MLSKLEAFKLGVLSEFASHGLSVEDMRERVKRASDALDAVAAVPTDEQVEEQSSMDKESWDKLVAVYGWDPLVRGRTKGWRTDSTNFIYFLF